MPDTPQSAPDTTGSGGPGGAGDPSSALSHPVQPDLGKSRPGAAVPESGGTAREPAAPSGYPAPPQPAPQAYDAGAAQAQHESPGAAGYPPFGGPGAAQHGGPVLSPPPVGGEQQPSYGPPGIGPAPEQRIYGYQAAAGVPGSLDVGHSLSYGWEKFRRNPGPWIAVTSLGLVLYLLFVLIVRIFEPTTLLPLVLIFLVVMAGLWLLQAALARGALYETDGYRSAFGSYFHLPNVGNVLLTALLAFSATSLASALCLVPGIAVGIGCVFSLHFVVDQDEGPVEAIRSSVLLVLANIWPVLLLVGSVIVMTFLGALLCGFGLLIAGPVSAIAVTYAYRTLTGGPISDI